MTRVKTPRRFKIVAASAIAVAAIGGTVVDTLPQTSTVSVTHTADTVDAGKLYNSAQKKFAAGDVTGGLTDLSTALRVVANDADALALQAIWADQADDAKTRDAALTRLSGVNSAAATTARNIIDGVTAAAAIIPDTTPKAVSGRTAIVVLGYGLTANGKMAPELVKRVTAGKEQADVAAGAPIVVTGGAPKKGVTEAAAMRNWLVGKGIAASRITAEDKSTSTVSNAQNTATLLKLQGITDVVLVTSPDHIRRAAADFAGAGLKVTGTLTTATNLSKYSKALTKDQQKGIRLESTRAAKIPVTKTEGIQLPGSLPDTGPGLITEIGGKILEGLMTGSKG
ncbi:YdcF family protein [Gordonia effusa]|uniref:YdcF family protein n=1 Tax=Gordonia effusa TaxID=263908 RepID=UPI0006826251|nr:YdcF family protein [Gordonia effusa]